METAARVEVLCEQIAFVPQPRVPGSTAVDAGCCGATVWLSPSSAALSPLVRCLPCAGYGQRLTRRDVFAAVAGGGVAGAAPGFFADAAAVAGPAGALRAAGFLAAAAASGRRG